MNLTDDVAPTDMLLFADVVREGSFTRAAQLRGITKQSLSERVARLEARLGVRLLERTTRRVRPTDVGTTYFERCASIAAQIDEANAAVREREAEPNGWLRISVPVLYGRRFLMPVLSAYLGRYPNARVEVMLADRRVNLIEEGFHLAIRVGRLDDTALIASSLGSGYTYCVASPSYLAQQGPLTRHNLSAARFIGFRPFESWNILGKNVKVAPVLLVNDLEVACDAALAGVGIAQVPSLICREAVAAGRLEVLFPKEQPPPQPIHVVYPSRQHLPAKVRLFVQLLRSLVAPMTPLEPPARRRRPSRGGTPKS